jgi:hypothetical protein
MMAGIGATAKLVILRVLPAQRHPNVVVTAETAATAKTINKSRFGIAVTILPGRLTKKAQLRHARGERLGAA